jgi:hypothetical protein
MMTEREKKLARLKELSAEEQPQYSFKRVKDSFQGSPATRWTSIHVYFASNYLSISDGEAGEHLLDYFSHDDISITYNIRFTEIEKITSVLREDYTPAIIDEQNSDAIAFYKRLRDNASLKEFFLLLLTFYGNFDDLEYQPSDMLFVYLREHGIFIQKAYFH